MSKTLYFSGIVELKNIHSIPVNGFIALGGVKSKHNRFDSFRRLAGYPVAGPLVVMPVTRTIHYKSNPSLHTCDARCMNATGHSCECSCGGKNHGAGNSMHTGDLF